MYRYEDLKPEILKEENQMNFLKVYDTIMKHPTEVISMSEAIANISGDNWEQMAYVDRFAELGLITEIRQEGDVAGQHRLFRK